MIHIGAPRKPGDPYGVRCPACQASPDQLCGVVDRELPKGAPFEQPHEERRDEAQSAESGRANG